MNEHAFSADRLARMRDIMARHVERGEMPGLVYTLHRHGETVIETIGAQSVAGDPMRRDSIFRIASMSKPILSVAAMMLVEECRLRLDDPVNEWLPELADRKVLKSREGSVNETVPAKRAITLRDILTMQLGLGVVMDWPAKYPFQQAMQAAGVSPGPHPYSMGHNDFMAGLGRLPLVHQPGEGWMYQTGYDVLGILVSRVAGKPLGAFLHERIFAPLGMRSTGFHVPSAETGRLTTVYSRNHERGDLAVEDAAQGGWYDGSPAFERAGAELVSTADDYLTFCRALLGGGKLDGVRLISRPTVELMTMDHTPDALKTGPDAAMFFANGGGWGFQMGVGVKRTQSWTNPGRFGWDGGYGTSAYTDPKEGLVAILLTQRMMDSPQPQKHYLDFWTSAYAAVA